MSFLELLLVLLLLSVGLLQVSRKVGLPYPTMLAAAGVLVALLPGAPRLAIDPAAALTLFIAPALVAAAYDFPIREVRILWPPLVAFAGIAVLATTGAVATFGIVEGLPPAASLALGAIVAPPDAAAATAILSTLRLPRSTDALIRGESLFNDAVALLLFELAISGAERGGIERETVLTLVSAAPLGIGLGVAAGLVACAIYRRVSGTLGETLLQFVIGMLVWVVATRLHASAALAVVGYALVVAQRSHTFISAQVRLHSSAVWNTAVFVLNVAAFLFMGMQARLIIGNLAVGDRAAAVGFAAGVLSIVVLVRLGVVIGFNRVNAAWHRRRGKAEPASLKQATLVGWTGMRGLVTLAAALALPPGFPARSTIVLAAFGVVLGTLVFQGGSLAILARWLDFAPNDGSDEEVEARRRLAIAGAAYVAALDTPFATELGGAYAAAIAGPVQLERFRADARAALEAERKELRGMVTSRRIDGGLASQLEQELDLRELSLLSAEDRAILEG